MLKTAALTLCGAPSPVSSLLLLHPNYWAPLQCWRVPPASRLLWRPALLNIWWGFIHKSTSSASSCCNLTDIHRQNVEKNPAPARSCSSKGTCFIFCFSFTKKTKTLDVYCVAYCSKMQSWIRVSKAYILYLRGSFMLFSTFVLCLSFCFAPGSCLFVLLLWSAVLFSAAPRWLSSRACKSVLLSGPCVMSSWPVPQLPSVWPFAFTFSFKSLKPVLNHFLTFSFRYFVSFLMFPQTCIIFYRSYSQSSASVQPSKSSASSSSQTASPVSQHP